MFHVNIRLPGRNQVLLLLLALTCGDGLAQTVSGRPLQILSGDRLLLMSQDNNLYRIVLAGIEAPPPESRWGAAAKRHLSTLVLGRVVSVESARLRPGTDELPARVLLGGADINLRMLQAGLARHKPGDRPADRRDGYAAAEQQARDAGQGIWSQQPTADRAFSRRIPGGPVPRLGK